MNNAQRKFKWAAAKFAETPSAANYNSLKTAMLVWELVFHHEEKEKMAARELERHGEGK